MSQHSDFADWLRRVFNIELIPDEPEFPWSLGTFSYHSLFDDPHTYPLAKLLEYGNKKLHADLFWQVKPAADKARDKEEEYGK